MTPEEINHLKEARERLCMHRNKIAQGIGSDSFASVELAKDLTAILVAIETIDRALNEAGHPYMSERLRVESDDHPAPQPRR